MPSAAREPGYGPDHAERPDGTPRRMAPQDASGRVGGPAGPLVHIDAASPTPVFEQIIEQLRRGAVQGSLPAGTRLPAVRALAGELGVAVNTVAKAYRQLEAEGTVATGGRNGTTIAALADAEPTRVAEAARTLIARARDAGLSRDQTLGLVARLW